MGVRENHKYFCVSVGHYHRWAPFVVFVSYTVCYDHPRNAANHLITKYKHPTHPPPARWWGACSPTGSWPQRAGPPSGCRAVCAYIYRGVYICERKRGLKGCGVVYMGLYIHTKLSTHLKNATTYTQTPYVHQVNHAEGEAHGDPQTHV